MIKKLALISIPLLFLVFVSVAKGQSLTFDRSYQDYQYNQTLYDQAYQDYVDAKNAYLQGGQTLPLKEDARVKTYTMLVDRDTLMSVYLTTLRTKISELSGLSPDDKNNIFGKIDPEVNFYNNHKSNYHPDDTLDQLFSTSSQSENQYKTKTILVVQESLFDISLGQVEGLRIAHEQVYSSLKSIINQGIAAGKLKIDPFSRWLTDIDTTDQTLKQNEITAKTQIAQIYTQSYSGSGGYSSAVNTLSNSLKSLSQFNQFLTEVLNYIKNNE